MRGMGAIVRGAESGLFQSWRQWYNGRLMSRDYPDWIHPAKAAQARREFSGSMALSRMERLSGVLAEPGNGEIRFRVVFGLNEFGQVRAEVSVSGSVPLLCQRTLKPFQLVLESCSTVGLVSDQEAAEALPDDYEPLLIEDGRVRLQDLVAEEVLLGIPLVPRAPESTPVGESATLAAETYKPFAGLASLAARADDDDSLKQE